MPTSKPAGPEQWQAVADFFGLPDDDSGKPLIGRLDDDEIARLLLRARTRLEDVRRGKVRAPVPIAILESVVQMLEQYLQDPTSVLSQYDPDAREKRPEVLYNRTGKPVVMNSEGWVVSSGDETIDGEVGLPGLAAQEYEQIVSGKLAETLVVVPAGRYQVRRIVVGRKVRHVHAGTQS